MPKEAYEGEPYRRSIPVEDPAGALDPVTFSLSGNPPEGIVIDEYSGLLLSAGEAREPWTPTYEQYRDNSPVNLQVRMTDDDGGSTIQLIEIPIIPIDDDDIQSRCWNSQLQNSNTNWRHAHQALGVFSAT